MTATALWASVVAAYNEQGLIELTNPRNVEIEIITTTNGESAAQEVIDSFPMYVEVDYDQANVQHVAVGRRATIAVLWDRGGSTTEIAEVKWDQIYDDEKGMMAKLRRTSARARTEPLTSGPDLSSDGSELLPYSDERSMPPGFLPARRGTTFDDD